MMVQFPLPLSPSLSLPFAPYYYCQPCKVSPSGYLLPILCEFLCLFLLVTCYELSYGLYFFHSPAMKNHFVCLSIYLFPILCEFFLDKTFLTTHLTCFDLSHIFSHFHVMKNQVVCLSICDPVYRLNR